MKNFILIVLFILTNICEAAYQVELEHTYAQTEGSSWGIEGTLKNNLNIPESNLPAIFKTPLTRAKPFILSVKEQALAANYFVNDTIFLYQKINICIDTQIDFKNKDFNKALDQFLEKVARLSTTQKSLDIQFISFDFKNFDNSKTTLCDAFALIGNQNEFPFAQVKNIPPPSFSKIPQILMGLYYRHSDNSIPVIVFNPKLQLDFHPVTTEYITVRSQNELGVDARTLFFHELGHLIGFSHLKQNGSWEPFSNLTVMGVNSTQSEQTQSDFRYQTQFDIWQNWDLQQTSIYRSLLARLYKGESLNSDKPLFGDSYSRLFKNYCVLPNEDLHLVFTPLGISELPEIQRPLDPTIQQPSISLNGRGQTVRLDSNRIKTTFYINQNENLEVFENHNTQMTPFFTATSLEKNFSQNSDPYYNPDSKSNPPKPDEILLLSLNGKVSTSATGHFSLSGNYTLSNTKIMSIPIIQFTIEADQSRCYVQ